MFRAAQAIRRRAAALCRHRGMSTLAQQEARPLAETARALGPAAGQQRGTIVFMHGLGDSADSFVGLFQDHLSSLVGRDGVRVVCLNAPERPITVNGGMEMPGWYDIESLDRSGPDAGAGPEDAAGIASSRERIHRLLEEELEAAPEAPLVVGGFSQGGAMAINAGLSFDRPLAGVVSLSGYVLERARLGELRAEANAETPVLAYHGVQDDMVPVKFAQDGYKQLREAGQPVDYTDEVGLTHTLSLPELHRMQHFFRERLELGPEPVPPTNEEFLEAKRQEDGVEATASGLLYKVLHRGEGQRKPALIDQVTVHYRGTLVDGTEFDSSIRRGEPATFGVGQVIGGWTEALSTLMHEGDKLELTIPSDLAYGPRGAGGVIGPDAVLVFEVELLKIQ